MLLRSGLKTRASWALGFIALSALVAYGCESTSGFDPTSELDQDGDGVADDLGKGIDEDGDGKLDPYGEGVAIDTDGDGEPDAAGFDTDGDGIIDAIDTDGDGEPDKFTELGDNPGTGTGAGSGTGTGSVGIPTGGGGEGNPGNGEPEVCDGKDNNANGIIDDVDAGGDGICDCLNIGTIGTIGPWGEGNIFADWLNSRSPLPATALDDDVLTSENLTSLDVIVVLRADTAGLDGDPAQHAFADAEVDALSAWVQGGGGLMTTIGYQGNEADEIVNVNRLLAPFGAAYSTDYSLTNYVTQWDQDHPIGAGVSNIFIDNGVTVDATSGVVVAVGDGDRTALVAHEPGDGHVIVWGDEWITYNETWADVENQQIELLWLNMIKWMSPPERCQVPIPPHIIR